MCGIVGYIGDNNIKNELIKSLKNLEYRGYDSAGIAYITNNHIETKKAQGKIENLTKKLNDKIDSTCGIGHTRWATHGDANETNAHPHNSSDGKWSVVHNGIIENYLCLKNFLIKNHNISFESETDTEVIPHILETKHGDNNIVKIIETCNELKGSFALAILNSNQPDTIYLAKRKSPLYLSTYNGEVFIASDPICFADKTTSFYSLNDNEYCVAQRNKLIFYDGKLNVIDKLPSNFNNINLYNNINNYKHYMLKEIHEVPEVLKTIAGKYRELCLLDNITKELIDKINRIIIIGCGTAYHAGLMGAKYIEKFARIKCDSIIASEFRYSNPIIDQHTLCIFVSQSGETADTIACATLAKEKGSQTIALTNVLYSTLAGLVDMVLPVCAGPEIAVASTKAYTAQITILYMLSRQIANLRYGKYFDYLTQINIFSQEIKLPDEKIAQDIANVLNQNNCIFFIGRDFDYISALESSLKLKEITYINAYAHPAGELKHGYLALVDSNTIVFVIGTNKELFEKTLNGAYEAQARGGKIILVSQKSLFKKSSNNFYKYLELQNFDEELMPIATIGIFQMISYFTSINKGINPDQPRNLAKSVTVE